MYYAENKTDKYIRKNFFLNNNINKIMVEVGAGPPEFLSMSKHFRDCGWRCICVEPNPKFVDQHKKLNNEIYQYACSFKEEEQDFEIYETKNWNEENNGISFSSLNRKYNIEENFVIKKIKVKTIKLNSLLENLNINKIDFLSIDVEGWELEVMKGFDSNIYNPSVIVLENFEHNDSYEKYMKNINYRLNKKIDYNYIFTR